MSKTLNLVSYNILANSYVKPQWFSKADKDILDWEVRKEFLYQKIINFHADVLCLQEVEPAVYAELNEILAGQGYSGDYQKKSGKPEGCATFVKTQHEFLGSEVIYYHQNTARTSGHLALVTCLGWQGKIIKIMNTHIKWDKSSPDTYEHIGYHEVLELLAYAQTNQGLGLIICGDFNAQANSDLIQEIIRHDFVDVYAAEPKFTSNSNQKAKRIDYIFVNKYLDVRAESIVDIDDQTILPTKNEPSDHLAIRARICFLQ